MSRRIQDAFSILAFKNEKRKIQTKSNSAFFLAQQRFFPLAFTKLGTLFFLNEAQNSQFLKIIPRLKPFICNIGPNILRIHGTLSPLKLLQLHHPTLHYIPTLNTCSRGEWTIECVFIWGRMVFSSSISFWFPILINKSQFLLPL